MPYKNAKQRAAMHIHAPKVARRWDKKYGAKIGGGKTKAQRKRGKK